MTDNAHLSAQPLGTKIQVLPNSWNARLKTEFRKNGQLKDD